MLKHPQLLLLILFGLWSASCTLHNEKNKIVGKVDVMEFTVCKNPRPQICSREYDPVCSSLSDGSKRTSATGCTACSNLAVLGYTMGAC